MHIFNLTVIFISGLCIGSFINVVIDRLPKGKSVSSGRSFCDHCKHSLSWFDLVPVVSFFILGRKCRFCHKKISWQYPTVELITGFFYVFVFQFFFLNYQLPITNYQFFLIYHLILTSGLIAIFFTDLKYRIIPDQILTLLAVSTLVFLLIFNKNQFLDHLFAATAMFLIFLSLVLLTRGRGMGMGDVKYVFVSGLILGLPASVVSFYLSFLTGAAVSLILVIGGKKTMKSTIPFGPFLVGGTFISLFYGQFLWNIFRKIIGI